MPNFVYSSFASTCFFHYSWLNLTSSSSFHVLGLIRVIAADAFFLSPFSLQRDFLTSSFFVFCCVLSSPQHILTCMSCIGIVAQRRWTLQLAPAAHDWKLCKNFVNPFYSIWLRFTTFRSENASTQTNLNRIDCVLCAVAAAEFCREQRMTMETNKVQISIHPTKKEEKTIKISAQLFAAAKIELRRDRM